MYLKICYIDHTSFFDKSLKFKKDLVKLVFNNGLKLIPMPHVPATMIWKVLIPVRLFLITIGTMFKL